VAGTARRQEKKVKTDNKIYYVSSGALPVYLIFYQTAAVLKVFNIKRHYETLH